MKIPNIIKDFPNIEDAGPHTLCPTPDPDRYPDRYLELLETAVDYLDNLVLGVVIICITLLAQLYTK